MANLNETPLANRIHIGVFGRTNSGKSTFINKFIGQNISITSDIKGTTTDPVYKSIEINPLGPCEIIDTPGFDDDTELGMLRTEKTKLAIEKADIALLVISAELFLEQITCDNDRNGVDLSLEKSYLSIFKRYKTPVIILVNKIDQIESHLLDIMFDKITLMINEELAGDFEKKIVFVSSIDGRGFDEVRNILSSQNDQYDIENSILGNLVYEGDSVVLVMPQDIQAPKGRLILPQVQTIRELLDRKCVITSVTTDKFIDALNKLSEAPKLIITDSQVFPYVSKNKPEESLLTSFSILMAAQKGDIEYFIEGSKVFEHMTCDSKVLISECCTHMPLNEDIGRVKIPNMLKKKYGESIHIDFVSGSDFEKYIQKNNKSDEEGKTYDLIIHCGACMYNRKYVLSRVMLAKELMIPMTNYGVAIAKLSGMLDEVVFP